MDAIVRNILERRLSKCRKELDDSMKVMRQYRDLTGEYEELVETLTKEMDAIEAELGAMVDA